MEPRDEADTISLSIDANQTRNLHALVLDRANRRAESIAGNTDIDGDFEQRLQQRVAALEAFARALADPTAGAVTYEPTDSEQARILRDELLDAYGSLRPTDAEELFDADAEVVATALAGYAHRHPATPEP